MTLPSLGAQPSSPRRARSIVVGLLAVVSVAALGLVPTACSSGGVGDPCTPEDEYDTQFSGFSVAQEDIESRSFQCQTRICLVNHFQGRVSCPQGQAAPTQCDPGKNGTDCPEATHTPCSTDADCGGTVGECLNGKCTGCALSEIYAPNCTPANPAMGIADSCTEGLTCDPNLLICVCTEAPAPINGVNFVCEPANSSEVTSPQVLHSYVCHIPNNCQTEAGGTTAANQLNGAPKDCCVPGTDSPVAVSVCGQCNDSSYRDANDAVYCSCRCCAPCCPPGTSEQDANAQGCSNDMSICGPACDPNFNYCSCPSGFTCTGINSNVGLGDAELTGAYCVKSGTAYTGDLGANCGSVVGYTADSSCSGTGTNIPTSADGGH